MGSGKGLITACVVNCHESSMEHINMEAHNPEIRIAGNVFYHCLVKFWIQSVQFLAAKTFVCRGNCYAVTTTNPPFGVPDSGTQTQRFCLSFAFSLRFGRFFTRRIRWSKLKRLKTTHFEKKTAKQRRKYPQQHLCLPCFT